MDTKTPSNDLIPKGVYIPRKPTDVRSPCPAINTLANHGYIARSGRNVRASEIHTALGELGIGNELGAIFTYPIFTEANTSAEATPPSWWSIIRNPFAYAFKSFALRNPGQVDTEGRPCLNLDQLAKPNVVEHDISLSRFDFAQGDNLSPQPELIKDILAASSNGSTLTMADFVRLRTARYERQKRENPKLQYGAMTHQVACSEVALLLKVFGNGSEVPVSHMKALFEEERLPREEGWGKRVWWKLGFVELNILAVRVKAMLGSLGEKEKPGVAAAH